ncbi:MAG: type II toxin-antitoxin system HipA family toxin [Pseudomonadota bacterium]
MAAERLLVFYQRELVGQLDRLDDGSLEFCYAPSWLGSPGRFAVSLSLPITGEAYAGAVVASFFGNLLPEGAVRTLVARRLGLSEDNDFALLRALGGECAGALTLVVDEPPAGPGSYEEIKRREILKLCADTAVAATLLGQGRLRLSMAGAQDKLPVLVEDGRFYLPLDGAPSTHLLKFSNRDFPNLPANEWFTTSLARRVGLPVVGLEVVLDGQACLVERFDRVRGVDGSVLRLHQEDFCQAFGLPRHTKYEQEGGPSFARCFELVTRESSDPLADSDTLLRWQVFNALVGAADGHAKNLALLYPALPSSPRLAPLYDLVCTRVYPRLSTRLAMRVGSVDDPGQLTSKDWGELARATGVSAPFLQKLVVGLADEVLGNVDAVAAELDAQLKATVGRDWLRPVVLKNARRVRKNCLPPKKG